MNETASCPSSIAETSSKAATSGSADQSSNNCVMTPNTNDTLELTAGDNLTFDIYLSHDGTSVSYTSDGNSELVKVESFSCTKCEFTTTSKHKLACHDLTIHSSHKESTASCGKAKPKIFSCKDCNFTTKYQHSLYRHQFIIHSNYDKLTLPELSHDGTSVSYTTDGNSELVNVESFSCTKCEFTTTSKYRLDRHDLTIHSSHKDFKESTASCGKASSKIFSCKECDYTTKHKGNLERHQLSLHKYMSFQCNECSYSTVNTRRLTQHKLLNHAVQGLTQHKQQNHAVNKSFKCDECSYLCADEPLLMIHKRIMHSKATHSKCAHCEQSFSSERVLQYHVLRKHPKVKSLKCAHCDFSCESEGMIVQHISSVHFSNDKPFKCDTCESIFTVKESLKVHMSTVHCKELLNCDKCEYITSMKNLLNQHILQIHTDNILQNCDKLSFSTVKVEEHSTNRPFMCDNDTDVSLSTQSCSIKEEIYVKEEIDVKEEMFVFEADVELS